MGASRHSHPLHLLWRTSFRNVVLTP
jgi:hypothetical protein